MSWVPKMVYLAPMFLYLLSFYFLGDSAKALVGGNYARQMPQVVEIKNRYAKTYCSGSVVGLNPLTILTASHCVERKYRIDINVSYLHPKLIFKGNSKVKALDIAVLVFDQGDIFSEDLKQTFTLEKTNIDLKKYHGMVFLCGSGREVNNVEGVQIGGHKKCGESLFIKNQSFVDSMFSLYSKKYLICKKWVDPKELDKLNYATAIRGDSGGPLFISKNKKLYLLGLLQSGVVNLDQGRKTESSICGVSYGESFRSDWIPLQSDNKVTLDFLRNTVKLGANITGIKRDL